MLQSTIKYKTPISYYGGKQQLVKKLLAMVPNHRIYCEPFFGGGALFFAKKQSYLEVINDTNDNLINFYLVLQNNFDDLQHLIQCTLSSESIFRWAHSVYFGTEKTDKIHRALATWVMCNDSFMCTPAGSWKWDNGTDNSHHGRVYEHLRRNFQPWLKHRLASVQISCRDALKVIRQRDTPETFFYLDPPYPGTDQGHYSGYTIEHLEQLLTLLQQIKGKFLLSNYANPLLEQYAARNNWQLKYLKMNKCAVNAFRKTTKTECLLFNYEIGHYHQLTLF